MVAYIPNIYATILSVDLAGKSLLPVSGFVTMVVMIVFSYSAVQSTLQHMSAVCEKMFLVGHQLNFFTFSGIIKWYLKKCGLTVRLLVVINITGDSLKSLQRCLWDTVANN